MTTPFNLYGAALSPKLRELIPCCFNKQEDVCIACLFGSVFQVAAALHESPRM